MKLHSSCILRRYRALSSNQADVSSEVSTVAVAAGLAGGGGRVGLIGAPAIAGAVQGGDLGRAAPQRRVAVARLACVAQQRADRPLVTVASIAARLLQHSPLYISASLQNFRQANR